MPPTRVIRERNEKGFLNFLQTLKSVLRLFIDQEGLVFSYDELEGSRNRLVDAAGTLTLIEHDISQRNVNVTGIPTVAVQLPIRSLTYSLVHLIKLLSAEMEKSEKTDLNNGDDFVYCAPLQLTVGPGRKPYDISKEQVAFCEGGGRVRLLIRLVILFMFSIASSAIFFISSAAILNFGMKACVRVRRAPSAKTHGICLMIQTCKKWVVHKDDSYMHER